MPIAECRCSHVTQADGAFATAVHKNIALVRMALSSCDYFCQFLHVGGLDVYNIWEHAVKELEVLCFIIMQYKDYRDTEMGNICFLMKKKDTKTSVCDFQVP